MLIKLPSHILFLHTIYCQTLLFTTTSLNTAKRHPDIIRIRGVSKLLLNCVTCYALTGDVVNLIGPWSTFTIWLAGRRFAIFVEGLASRSTWCAPTTILNCKNVESSFLSCSIALFDGVLSCLVVAIQDGILSFYWWYGAASVILKTSNCLVPRTIICYDRLSNAHSLMNWLLFRLDFYLVLCRDNYLQSLSKWWTKKLIR